MALADPFPLAKEEVQQSLGVAKALHSRWKELAESDSASNEELTWTRSMLIETVQGIETDITTMKQALQVLERDRKIQIEPGELEVRKAFVADCMNKVKSYRNDVMDPKLQRIQSQKEEHEKLLTASNVVSKESKARMRSERNNQDFIEDQQQQQTQIMRAQDEDLQDLGHTISRLNQIGGAISHELDDHARMLDEVDGEMDRTEGRLQMVMSKVELLLKSSDNKKILTIVVLIFIIIGLFVAVIYA
eukprot:c2135_g1_i1.p1 GENE.c2135_g1_i1~~c2135_g1_i1.p1  ORF type:complete len:247 (-),score=88.24 c2135_g1_i1:76-816(-)